MGNFFFFPDREFWEDVKFRRSAKAAGYGEDAYEAVWVLERLYDSNYATIGITLSKAINEPEKNMLIVIREILKEYEEKKFDRLPLALAIKFCDATESYLKALGLPIVAVNTGKCDEAIVEAARRRGWKLRSLEDNK